MPLVSTTESNRVERQPNLSLGPSTRVNLFSSSAEHLLPPSCVAWTDKDFNPVFALLLFVPRSYCFLAGASDKRIESLLTIKFRPAALEMEPKQMCFKKWFARAKIRLFWCLYTDFPTNTCFTFN